MKILIQNLQKRSGLATQLIEEHQPQIVLAQEIHLSSEGYRFQAWNVSKRSGYGTAIGTRDFEIQNIKRVDSPSAEVGGFIRKKTTIATIQSVQYVSFHGYNGQPFQDQQKLVDHIEAVLAVLEAGPALFAGDFNTWTKEHFDAVTAAMTRAHFQHAYSWPYDGRNFPLDHAYVRSLEVTQSEHYTCSSDHRGAILEIETIN